jgi:phosphomannomutase
MCAPQGLCAYIIANVNDAASRGVVVGYDHRHNSERWAQLTAAVFMAKGVKAYLLRGLVPTPMWVHMEISLIYSYALSIRVPFSVKRLNAACGVMITGA